uniref:F-box domain-containing protein n=1 Tax=Oryza punctata TaxID=4537 RepID=A0A0E0MPZ5_ORYPU
MDCCSQLPGDLLADILRRLPARSLATARGVCSTWRAIVDEHSLIAQVAALLPNDLRGLFVGLNDSCLQGFFARPSPAGPAIPGVDLDFVDDPVYDFDDYGTIENHCNGLLLLEGYIVNPATRQWMRLPPLDNTNLLLLANDIATSIWSYGDRGLVFDPAAVSPPHYDVIRMPHLMLQPDQLPAVASLPEQWPPSPLVLHVFSSRTGRWEEKSFIREGDTTMGTIADVCLASQPYCQKHSVYLRGALYMHCQNDCIIKITPANHKYRVIKLPGDFASNINAGDPFLGKSKGKVYCALLTRPRRLKIWFLNETSSSYDDSSGYEWVLKHDDVNLGPIIQSYPCNHGGQQWIWSNYDTKQDKSRELPVNEEEFEWANDDDDDDNTRDAGENKSIHHNGRYISRILGFHPFRDIIFLYDTGIRVVAYDYGKAKIE